MLISTVLLTRLVIGTLTYDAPPDWVGTLPLTEAGYFGRSVAGLGDVNGDGYPDLAVSQDAGTKRIRVYYGTATGFAANPDWSGNLTTGGEKIIGPGDLDGDGYDDLVVSAAFSGAGAVYVYRGSASGMVDTPLVLEPCSQRGCQFGLALAAAGDIDRDGRADFIVGAPGDGADGRVYVYAGSTSGPVLKKVIEAPPVYGSADFGRFVAGVGDINGDGTPDMALGSEEYGRGRVDFYYGSAHAGPPSTPSATVMLPSHTLELRAIHPAGDVNGDGFADVAIGMSDTANDTTTVLLGGLAAPSFGASASDSCSGRLRGPGGDFNGDGFADLITSAGQRVGTTLGSWAGILGGDCGAAVLVSSTNDVVTIGDINSDGFADFAIGNTTEVVDGFGDRGAVRVYYGSGDRAGGYNVKNVSGGAGYDSVWGSQPDAWFGAVLGNAGDVDGDGLDEILVGAPRYDTRSAYDAGAVYLYEGTSSGLVTSPSWSRYGEGAWRLGSSATGVGDVDGDGYEDVLVGAPRYSSSYTWEGRVELYHGGSSGLAVAPAWTLSGGADDALMGAQVARAGDVNGDGYADFLVAAPGYSNEAGRVELYIGSAIGPLLFWDLDGDYSFDHLGEGVAGAGDVNGDGFDDIVIGAPGGSNPELSEGYAYLYLGGATNMTWGAWFTDGGQSGARFAERLAGVGDVNGDGFDDVVVGAPGWDTTDLNVGKIALYYGSSQGLSATPAFEKTGWAAGDALGSALAKLGDVNGDGFTDFAAGAPGGTFSYSDEGRAQEFYGSMTLPEQGVLRLGFSVDAALGSAITGADLDGNGYGDVVYGVPFLSSGYPNYQITGQIRGYYGNDFGPMNPGRPVFAGQRNGATWAFVGPGGRVPATSGVRLELRANSPFGRGRVKLETEVKPIGVSFDGSGTQIDPAFSDSGLTGTIRAHVWPNLAPSQAYQWRARVVYDPRDAPLARHGPWLSPTRVSLGRADFRTSP